MDCERNIHKYIDHKDFWNAIVCAPQKSGKTYFIKKMFEKYYSFYDGIFVCTPHDDNPLLKIKVPDPQNPKKLVYATKHLKCDDDEVASFVQLCHEGRQQGIDFKIMIIFDDYLGFLTLKGKKSAYITKLASSSRHMKISTIWITQSWTDNLSTALKASCRHLFLMPRLPESQIESISGILPQCEFSNYQQFYNEYKKLTGSYNFIYINKNGDTKKAVYFCSALENGRRFRFHELCRESGDDRDESEAVRALREHYERIRAEDAESIPFDSERRRFEIEQGFSGKTRIVPEKSRRKM